MIVALLAVYLGLIIGTVLTTVLLIFFGYGWGPLPHIYIRLIEFFQNFYPLNYPKSDLGWPGILRRCDASELEKHRNDSLSSFKFRFLFIKNFKLLFSVTDFFFWHLYRFTVGLSYLLGIC